MHTADYCPLNNMAVTGTNANLSYDLSCEDDELESSVDAEFFGMNSKCIENSLSRPLCMKTECNMELNKVIIMVGEGEAFIPILCENSGDIMDLPGYPSETFECPPMNIICPE